VAFEHGQRPVQRIALARLSLDEGHLAQDGELHGGCVRTAHGFLL
jgi:hypothetical protein